MFCTCLFLVVVYSAKLCGDVIGLDEGLRLSHSVGEGVKGFLVGFADNT
jgi:hypothetical protein